MEFEHGGNIYDACKKLNVNKKDLLDFSANINPLGIPTELKNQLVISINNLEDYPDPNCGELRENISKYVGAPTHNIIVGNGASEIIYLLFRVLEFKHVTIPAPCFSEYSKAAAYWNVEVDYFEVKESENFKLNIDALKKYIKPKTECIFLCNPNNPTSTLMSKDDLINLLNFCKDTKRFLIIDEAFIELTVKSQENSMVALTKYYKNLFVIRAFTKILAVPGLRLGYGIGDERIIRKMWEQKLTWSVNTFACSVGNSLDKLKNYFNKTRIWLANESEWIYNELCLLGYFKVYMPSTNFVLLKILKQDKKFSLKEEIHSKKGIGLKEEFVLNSALLVEEMANKGVLIRNASNFMYLDDSFVRVAIKDRESNLKLLKVLRECFD